MFSPHSFSQILGFSPNNSRCYASTSLLQHKHTIFAFGSDNLLFLFDRLTLKSSIITAPDPSSEIVAITFTGYDKDTVLLCANSSGKLYSFLLENPDKPIMEADLGCVPTSMAASNEFLFVKSDYNLFAVKIGKDWIGKDRIILSETLVHDKCSVSPCGRGLATYSIGSNYPVLWYAPYERRRRSNLPIVGHITSFEWGTAEQLIAVTATEEGIVRLWVESTTNYELRCVKWFNFDSRVLSAAICISSDVENQIQLKNCQKAASDSGRVFPIMKRLRALILAAVGGDQPSVCILQEKSEPKMCLLGSVKMNVDDFCITQCDMRRIFSDGELKRMVSALRFSNSSLSFIQFEIGKHKLTHIFPLRFNFIKSEITRIFKKNRILTQHKDGSLFDWFMYKKAQTTHNYLDNCNFKHGMLCVTPNSLFFEFGKPNEYPTINFQDPMNFATIQIFGETALILATNLETVKMFYFSEVASPENQKTSIFKFSEIEINNSSKDILSGSIHSTDLFILSTKTSVDAYFFKKQSNHQENNLLFSLNNYTPKKIIDQDKNKMGHYFYEKFATLEADHPYSIFIPHSLVLVAVSFPKYLKFFIIWYNSFIPIDEIDPKLKNEFEYPKFNAMNILDNGSILASSKNGFHEIYFKTENFPSPYPLKSNFTILTAFSLGYFYQLNEFLSNNDITFETFTKKMPSENFSFPSTLPPETYAPIAQFCQHPPPSWSTLDESAQKFLFSWTLSKNTPELWRYIPFFGIWALISKDQATLIESLEIQTAKNLYDMNFYLWAKDSIIIKKTLILLVENTVPPDNEVDTYLLFCILLDRKHTAKRIARVKNEAKLASFFGSLSDASIETDAKLRSRIEKSAYEAQKKHRCALAAMFFCLRKMYSQALIVLKNDRPLLILTARLFGNENWSEHILPHLMDGFYQKWWNNQREEAAQTLKNWKCPQSDLLSIELHRIELLKKLQVYEPHDILSIQFTPGFSLFNLSDLIEIDQNDASDSLTDNENQEELKNVSVPDNDESIVKDVSTFDFGGAGDDWDDYDMFDSDDESPDDSKNEGSLNDESAQNKDSEEISDNKDSLLFESNFKLMALRSSFKSPSPTVFTFDEEYIVYLISTILNESYNEHTLSLVSHLAIDLFQKMKSLPANSPSLKQQFPILIALLYTITFVSSKPNLMASLFMSPLTIDSISPIIDEFKNNPIKYDCNHPNLLRRFVMSDVLVKETDRELANFLSFHEICKVFIRQGALKQHTMMISFFHHHHRLLFANLKSYTFTEFNYSLDMETIGLKCEDVSERMEETLLSKKWLVSIVNPFISPFYFGDHFQASRSFEKNTHFDGSREKPLTAICINPKNQNEIAVGSTVGVEFIDLKKILNASMTSSTDNSPENSASPAFDENLTPFDSPFTPVMSPIKTKAQQDTFIGSGYFQRRDFTPLWKKHQTPVRDLEVTCLASHPREPFFVAGTLSGRIYLAPFGTKYANTTSSVMYSDCPVVSVSMNETGDRVLITTKDGYIYVNDFKSANLFASVEGSSACWLNCDTQIIVCEPMNDQFVVYDINAGDLPVATFKLPKRSKKVPLAVSGSQIFTGHEDGSVVIFDIRSQQHTSINISNSPITVLKHDSSTRFFVAGSADNSLQVINAYVDSTPQVLPNVFSSYNESEDVEYRGVTDIAVSDMTIVACGFSPSIHAWTVTDPRGLFY